MLVKPLETEAELRGKAYVHCRAWKEAYAGLVDQAFLDGRTEEMSRQSAQRAFENGVSTFVAKDGDRVVGFVDCGRYRGEDLRDTGEIYALYVLREYYGRGLGWALMDHALDALRDYRQIALWVLSGNERAIRFYRRIGFDLDGEKQILTLGTPVTDLRMRLQRSSRSGEQNL